MSLSSWLDNVWALSVQLAALITVGGVIPLLFRLRAPVFLHFYWCLLLALCLLSPLLQPWHSQEPALQSSLVQEAELLPTLASGVLGSPIHRAFFLERAVALVLVSGVVARLLWLLVGLFRFRSYRLRAQVFTSMSAPLQKLHRRLAEGSRMYISDEIKGPVTFGVFRPAVIFPSEFGQMEERLQIPVTCHELLHVRRRDWLFHLWEELVRALLWFHPAVWWLLGKIRLTREQMVDQQVVRLTGTRKAYLDALLLMANRQAATIVLPAPLLLQEHHLIQRVGLIVREVSMSRKRIILSATIAIGLVSFTFQLAARSFPLIAPVESPRVVPGQQKVVTEDGKIVILKADGTWEYADVFKPGKGVTLPVLVKKTTPSYTQEARASRTSGVVILSCIVRKSGRAEECKAVKSRAHGLTERAIEEIQSNWRFQPGRLQGQPVDVESFIEITFKNP